MKASHWSRQGRKKLHGDKVREKRGHKSILVPRAASISIILSDKGERKREREGGREGEGEQTLSTCT